MCYFSGTSHDSSVKAVGAMCASKGAAQDLELQAREFTLIGRSNTEVRVISMD